MILYSNHATVGLSFVALFVIQTTLFSDFEVWGTAIDGNNGPMGDNENTALELS